MQISNHRVVLHLPSTETGKRCARAYSAQPFQLLWQNTKRIIVTEITSKERIFPRLTQTGRRVQFIRQRCDPLRDIAHFHLILQPVALTFNLKYHKIKRKKQDKRNTIEEKKFKAKAGDKQAQAKRFSLTDKFCRIISLLTLCNNEKKKNQTFNNR